jgi:hypothetical protein
VNGCREPLASEELLPIAYPVVASTEIHGNVVQPICVKDHKVLVSRLRRDASRTGRVAELNSEAQVLQQYFVETRAVPFLKQLISQLKVNEGLMINRP